MYELRLFLVFFAVARNGLASVRRRSPNEKVSMAFHKYIWRNIFWRRFAETERPAITRLFHMRHYGIG